MLRQRIHAKMGGGVAMFYYRTNTKIVEKIHRMRTPVVKFPVATEPRLPVRVRTQILGLARRVWSLGPLVRRLILKETDPALRYHDLHTHIPF